MEKGWFGQEPFLTATEKLNADRGHLEDKDLLNAGDGCLGPDIGPGLGVIARRGDLDQQDCRNRGIRVLARISQTVLDLFRYNAVSSHAWFGEPERMSLGGF
ncbi:MAG TPA: hypothetical protein VLZ74_15915 [Methylocella sp.]|nr:hypothetical protein [Methylocella sp.]